LGESALQYGVSAEADGAVHITPAARAAAATPTVAINTFVFMRVSFSLKDDGILPPHVRTLTGKSSAIVVRYDLMDNSYKSAGEHDPVGVERPWGE
jgi:hypothetical protein